MPLSDAELKRYRTQLATYRRRTSALLAALWDGLDSYDEEAAERYAISAAPILAGAKQASVSASVAMFALSQGIRPPSVPLDAVDVVARIDHPFLALWHAVNEGRPNEEALLAGRNQAEAVGADFVQQTARRTGDVAARESGTRVRWRRVPEPKACSWCRTVAGQLYRTAESADFGHDRCYCDVVPA